MVHNSDSENLEYVAVKKQSKIKKNSKQTRQFPVYLREVASISSANGIIYRLCLQFTTPE